jgi:hypothetical protein
MTSREFYVASGVIVPATSSGDPSKLRWLDEPPTLRLDPLGRLEAERERTRAPRERWQPPWDVLR